MKEINLKKLKPFEILVFLFILTIFIIFISLFIDRKTNEKLLVFIYKNQEKTLNSMISTLESKSIEKNILLENIAVNFDKGVPFENLNNQIIIYNIFNKIVFNNTKIKDIDTLTRIKANKIIMQIGKNENEGLIFFYLRYNNKFFVTFEKISNIFKPVFINYYRYFLYDKANKRFYTNEFTSFLKNIDKYISEKNNHIKQKNSDYLMSVLPIYNNLYIGTFAPLSEYLIDLHTYDKGNFEYTGLFFGLAILILLIFIRYYITRFAFEKEKFEKLFFLEQEKFQSIVEAIGEGVALIDTNYNIMWYNDFIKSHLKNNFQGKCYQVLAGNNKICEGCKYQKVIDEKKVQKMNYINYITGRKGHYEVILSPLVDEEGKVVAVVDLIIDVTENINMQQKMLQSEKLSALGLLAGGIAHEINNPLVGILNFAQLLSKKIDKESYEGKLVHTIIEAGTETKRIVQNLLVYARQNVDKKETFDLKESVDFATKILNTKIKAKNINIKVIENNKFIVKANKGQIHQVFLNLLSNSIDASKINGKINIELNYNKKYIKIEDNGVGIKKENLDKIFDPFFTTKDVGEGTGLGLSIISSIIHEHNWTIQVESEVNKLTVFTINIEE